MDRCRDRMIPDPVELRGHWRDLMPQARELRVELGCGKGRFTAETAGLEPDVLFVAVERVPDAMIVAMERVVEKGLSNVFFVDGDAARLRGLFARLPAVWPDRYGTGDGPRRIRRHQRESSAEDELALGREAGYGYFPIRPATTYVLG